MKLYVMRHGEAVPPQVGFARPGTDAARVLTPQGHQDAIQASLWIARRQKLIDLALVSPYQRAQETFYHVQQQVQVDQIESCAEITPVGQAEFFISELMARVEQENVQSVLLVSHMPFVSYVVAFLDSSLAPPLFPTSGIACLEVDAHQLRGQLTEFYRNLP